MSHRPDLSGNPAALFRSRHVSTEGLYGVFEASSALVKRPRKKSVAAFCLNCNGSRNMKLSYCWDGRHFGTHTIYSARYLNIKIK